MATVALDRLGLCLVCILGEWSRRLGWGKSGDDLDVPQPVYQGSRQLPDDRF